MEIDRRKTFRIPFAQEQGRHVAFLPIGITGRIKPAQTGQVFNLSEDGMSALIHMKVRKRKKFWVEINLPGLLQNLRVRAKAVWVEKDTNGTQVGLTFIQPSASVLAAVRKVAYDFRVCEAGIAFALANVCKRQCTYWMSCKKPIKLKG
jgi:hypothetical protein